MSAKAVFDEIVVAEWDAVLDWKAKQQEESLHLDFKRRARGAGTALDAADKNCISKALSGFANVEGGVLVLGVEAKGSDKNAPDRVSEITPVENVARFANLVDRNLKNFTNPPIAGLTVKTIMEPGHERGVAIIYVPMSDGGPHRTALGDSETNERYYMRTGTNTVIMPHPQLAAMFGRRPQPKLRLVVKALPISEEPAPHRQLLCWLRNDGRGPAMRPRVLVVVRGAELTFHGARVTMESSGEAVARLRMQHDQTWDDTIYPGEQVQMMGGRFTGKADAFRLRGRIYALDAEPVAFEHELDLRSHSQIVSIPENHGDEA
jgi:hypothetical protein